MFMFICKECYQSFQIPQVYVLHNYLLYTLSASNTALKKQNSLERIFYERDWGLFVLQNRFPTYFCYNCLTPSFDPSNHHIFEDFYDSVRRRSSMR